MHEGHGLIIWLDLIVFAKGSTTAKGLVFLPGNNVVHELASEQHVHFRWTTIPMACWHGGLAHPGLPAENFSMNGVHRTQ